MRTEASNFVLLLLLMIAGYLSAATIVALPTQLEDVAAAQHDLEVLAATLRAEDHKLASRIGPMEKQAPFSVLTNALQSPRRMPDGPMVLAELAGHQAKRTRLIDEVNNARSYWAARVKRASDHAIAVFTENVDRKGNAERREHATALLTWYDHLLGESQRELDECLGSAAVADSDAGDWARDRARLLARQHERAVSREVRWDRALEQCAQRWESSPVPQRPELGRRFGPFQLIAAWLVRTESLSIMASVGLLGFGLLGAAASSFIRDQRVRRASDRSESVPLVSDLSAVVVRGLVAAVVVFLAVKGGLSVFAVDSPDPNPYVLLLTCLVAAIFSEPVFEWARERIGLPSPDHGERDMSADNARPTEP